MDYQRLVKTLGQRFKPEGREELYKAEFRQRGRKKDETFMEFGYELRRLSNRAFPKKSQDARDLMVFEQFLSGLSDPDLHKFVTLEHPQDIDKAITLATEFETVSLSSRSGFPKKPLSVAVLSSSQNTEIDLLNSMIDHLKELTKKLDQPWCTKCSKRGHSWRKCPEDGKAENTQNKSLN